MNTQNNHTEGTLVVQRSLLNTKTPYTIGLKEDSGAILAEIRADIFDERLDAKEAKANADRLVKCWNEYDKLKNAARLLEELTPQGSEFYDDPEYCAKWVKEQLTGIPKAILPFKKENDKLKEENAALLDALKQAQSMLFNLRLSYCENKNGELKRDAAANGWDAEVDCLISDVINKNI